MHRRAVILRHTLPDGSSHLDLLLERAPSSERTGADPDDRRLIAFRLPDPLPADRRLVLHAHRLPDHRAHYLDFEGEIDAERGAVKRLLTARLTTLHESPAQIDAQFTAPTETTSIQARHVRESLWQLRIERDPNEERAGSP